MREAASSRAASAVLIPALLSFLLLSALAAEAYPGGTYCEPDASSYRFWGNFLCDLTADITRRGEDNSRAAAFARAAFGVFGVGLVPFFWLLGGLTARGRAAVRALGVIAGVATLLLAWVPSRAGLFLHAGFVFAATVPGLIAATLGAVAVVRRARKDAAMRVIALFAVLALSTAGADAAGYVYALATSADCLAWLPLLQKFAALWVIAWMFSVALYALYRPRAS